VDAGGTESETGDENWVLVFDMLIIFSYALKRMTDNCTIARQCMTFANSTSKTALNVLVRFRPHCQRGVLNAAYCYTYIARSVVCVSVFYRHTGDPPCNTAELIEISFGTDSCGPKGPCATWGAHWRYLANTTDISVCGGDAAFCQITWGV